MQKAARSQYAIFLTLCWLCCSCKRGPRLLTSECRSLLHIETVAGPVIVAHCTAAGCTSP